MIEGVVSGNSEAIIRLSVRAVAGTMQEIDAIIDTGFSGDLTLPPALIRRLNLPWKGRSQALLADGGRHTFDEYVGTVSWNGQSHTVEVSSADTNPLVGMGLLRGHRLSMDVIENGAVTIDALT